MAMRYLIRRKNPENLQDLQALWPDLLVSLGPAAANLQRDITHRINHRRSVSYHLESKKKEQSYVWLCPSIELTAETEAELLTLCLDFGIARGQLSHLPR